jgi:Zn-finger nucleic acid-binding protein
MNCSNCGGAMELIAPHGYFFCRYCGSFHFPESTSDQGIRILGDGPRPMACAACKGPLAASLLDEQHPVQHCRNCRGVLAARTTFAGVVQARRAWATDPPAAPVPLDKSELDRQLSCPSCQQPMITHPYFGPGNVVIDSCPACDLVWLDFGELKQITAAPGKDRGRREAPEPPISYEPPQTLASSAMNRGGDASFELFDLLTDLFVDPF